MNSFEGDVVSPLNLAQWDTKPIPPRLWAVHDRFPLKNVALLSGEGGTGKTILLQQLAVAHVLGRDWLRSVPERGPALIVNCEDEECEIVHRLKATLDHYGAKFADLGQRLRIFSFAGQDAVLAAPDYQGQIEPTPLFNQLYFTAVELQPVTIVLDNAADIFGGNENDRVQVRQFVTILRRLAIDANAAVIVSSHPSLTGIASKTGLSGSTAWHGSVRARAWLRSRTTEEGDEPDPNARELVFMKNQYGKLTDTIPLRWQNGLFVPEPHPDSLEQMARDKETDDLFLTLLAKFTEQGQNVTVHTGTSYAPAKFAQHHGAKGTKSEAFARAMQRLLDRKQIVNLTFGPPSKLRTKLVLGNGP